MCHGSGMRAAGVDAARRGWVAVSLEASGHAHRTGSGDRPWGLRAAPWTGRAPWSSGSTCRSGCWRRAGARRTGPPAACSAPGAARSSRSRPGRSGRSQLPAANLRCRELTGQGLSAQAWGLRAKLLEANQYRQACGHPLYEVHPELAFGAMAGAPLGAASTPAPAATNGGGC